MSTPLPSFSEQYANVPDPGTRFHTFIQALFAPDYPGFAAFTGAGKDGAIDCFQAAGGVV